MCDISPAVLRGHIVTLESELSPRYARPILGSLSNIFETAIDDKRLVRNPMRAKSMRWPKARRIGEKPGPWRPRST
ncbi:hypothetical protein ACIPJQ_10925 [Streptomyces griseoviridis]